MACNPIDPVSCVIDGVASAATSSLGNSFADAMRDGASWVLRTTIAWWIEVPAIDLNRSPVDTIRGYVMWLAIAVAVAGVMWQGVMLALSRRPDPLLNVGRGLFYLALWSSIGVIGPAAALRAGDSFSSWVLGQAAGGQALDRLVALGSLQAVQSPGAVTLLGLLMMLAGLVQAILMIFREGAVVILSGVVVLAAAGSFTGATRPWLPRVVGWLLALVTYKPAAALVYASALALIGEAQDPRTIVVGLTMMLLSLVALPVLMKFFTWTTGTASGGASGGLAALAAGSAASIHAWAAFDSAPGRGGAAAAQASNVRNDLGPTSDAPSGAVPTTTGPSTAAPPGSPTGGAAPTSTAGASAGTGATGTAASSAGAGAAATSGAAAAGPAGAVVLAADAVKSAAASAARVTGSALTDEGSR